MSPIRFMPLPGTGAPDSRLLRGAMCLTLLLFLGLSSLPALAATIDVNLDRNPVPANESFTIIFTADGEPDGEPDFSPLQKDFEIINQNQSSQFSLVNGHASRQITWQVGVVARQTGALQIPAITFGKDRSRPFTVNITYGAVRGKQGANADLFVEMDAEPRNPYVQAQTRLTIRVLSRVRFSGELSEPKIDGAVVEKLDNDHVYLTDREGVQFNVNERTYALFPQKSGRQTIDPVNLTAQLEEAGKPAFFGPFGRSGGRTLRLHSDPVVLEVRAIPAAFTGKTWLPTARLTLDEAWTPQPPNAPVGDPVTRTLTLKAEGATVGLLPELGVYTPEQPNLKQYPDQPVVKEEKLKDGFVSTRQQKTALIGGVPGTYRFAAIEIPWWNTKTDRMEIARLPERSLTVTAGAGAATPTHATVNPLPAPVVTRPDPDRETDSPDAGTLMPPLSGTESSSGFWLTLFLGTGWFLTAVAWIWQARARGAAPSPAPAPQGLTERTLIRAVEQACRSNNAAAARHSLTQWAQFQWPDGNAMTLEERVGGILGEEIGLLNRSLYAPGAGAWQGSGLWTRFQDYVNTGKHEGSASRKAAASLAPLHRL